MAEVGSGAARHIQLDRRTATRDDAMIDFRLPAGGLPGDPAEETWVVYSRSVPIDVARLADIRRTVRGVLSGWLAGPVVDDVVLVASELMANALRHGCVAEPSSGVPDAVRIGLCRTDRDVMLFVCDPSPAGPRPRVDPTGMTGRGLELVDSLSSAWGWTPGRWVGKRRVAGSERYGKTVWARFGLVAAEGGAA